MIPAYSFYSVHLEFDFLGSQRSFVKFYLPRSKFCNKDIIVDGLYGGILKPNGLFSFRNPLNISTVDYILMSLID